MWFVLAVVMLAPIVWALAGAPAVPGLDAWLSEYLPQFATRATAPQGALVAAALAGTALGIGRARVTTTHVSTLAHEFGHGLTAALLGGRIDRIRTYRDGSGIAHTALPERRPMRAFMVSAAGYLTPGVVALASMRMAVAGLAAPWLAYLVAVTAVMLVLAIRSWWGLLVTLVLGAAGWVAVVFAPDVVVASLVAGLAGVLAGGGTVDAWEQWAARSVDTLADASSMAVQTRLPVGLFAGLHLLVAGGLAAATLAVPVWP